MDHRILLGSSLEPLYPSENLTCVLVLSLSLPLSPARLPVNMHGSVLLSHFWSSCSCSCLWLHAELFLRVLLTRIATPFAFILSACRWLRAATNCGYYFMSTFASSTTIVMRAYFFALQCSVPWGSNRGDDVNEQLSAWYSIRLNAKSRIPDLLSGAFDVMCSISIILIAIILGYAK